MLVALILSMIPRNAADDLFSIPKNRVFKICGSIDVLVMMGLELFFRAIDDTTIVKSAGYHTLLFTIPTISWAHLWQRRKQSASMHQPLGRA